MVSFRTPSSSAASQRPTWFHVLAASDSAMTISPPLDTEVAANTPVAVMQPAVSFASAPPTTPGKVLPVTSDDDGHKQLPSTMGRFGLVAVSTDSDMVCGWMLRACACVCVCVCVSRDVVGGVEASMGVADTCVCVCVCVCVVFFLAPLLCLLSPPLSPCLSFLSSFVAATCHRDPRDGTRTPWSGGHVVAHTQHPSPRHVVRGHH
mgnify:CR=1 FL=1